MSKIDLGLVGVFPWTPLSELYTFPTNSNYSYSGGYKVVNGTCFIDVTIHATGNASVTLPKIKSGGTNVTRKYTTASAIVPALYQTGEGTQLTSNVLTLKANDYVTIYGYYEVG